MVNTMIITLVCQYSMVDTVTRQHAFGVVVPYFPHVSDEVCYVHQFLRRITTCDNYFGRRMLSGENFENIIYGEKVQMNRDCQLIHNNHIPFPRAQPFAACGEPPHCHLPICIIGLPVKTATLSELLDVQQSETGVWEFR